MLASATAEGTTSFGIRTRDDYMSPVLAAKVAERYIRRFLPAFHRVGFRTLNLRPP